MQRPARERGGERRTAAKGHGVALLRPSDEVYVRPKRVHRPEMREDPLEVVTRHLQNGTRLLAEERGERVRPERPQVDIDAASAGEGHLAERCGETAVGAVVVGEYPARLVQMLHAAKEVGERPRGVEVRGLVPDRLVHQGEGGTTQALPSEPEVDEDEPVAAGGQTELGRERPAHVAHRRECGHDERERRAHAPGAAFLAPQRLHGQGVLAHRDRDPERGTELLRHRAHGVEELGVRAGMAAGRHPVGGEHDPVQAFDACGGDVRQRFRHRHPPGRGRVDEGERSAFAHRHRFAPVSPVVDQSHRAVGDRNLPGTHHLVPAHQAGDAAVADGDEKALVGHRGQTQHPVERPVQLEPRGGESPAHGAPSPGLAVFGGKAAEQCLERHFHRVRASTATSAQAQDALPRHRADACEGAALALAECREFVQPRLLHRDDEAFLCLVAPELERRHAGIPRGDRPEIEGAAARRGVDQLRDGVGETARADIVDRENRVGGPERDAVIDHLLTAALHFRVVPLHRGEIQRFLALAGGERGCRAASEPDQQGRPSEHDDVGAGRNRPLFRVAAMNGSHPPRDHDGLVVAAQIRLSAFARVDLERAEVAGQRGTSELVAEARGAERRLGHDVERGGDSIRLAEVPFPRVHEVRNAQVGHRVAGETGLAEGPASRGRLVADLSTRSRRGARERGDGGGMIVGLRLEHDVEHVLAHRVAAGAGLRAQPLGRGSLDHRGVVPVGGEHATGVLRVSAPDHLEECRTLFLAAYRPPGVEDLVAAVLGVDLREHHQLDIVGIAAEDGECGEQVIDFDVVEGEAHGGVRLFERRAASRCDIDLPKRRRRGAREDFFRRNAARAQRFGHAIVQKRAEGGAQRLGGGIGPGEAPPGPALDTLDRLEAASPGDVGRLGRPW